jgi:hypothetical protein
MNRERLRELASAQIDGHLPAEGFDELESLLADQGARREYLQYVFLHGELACAEDVLRSLSEQEVTVTPASRKSLASFWSMALAAGLLVAVTVTASFIHPRPPSEPSTIGTLASVAAFDWQAAPPLNTASLSPGTVRMAGGEANIRFRGGADVTLAGPAVYGVSGQDHSALFAGRLAARVHDARLPFVIETPGVRVVDRGTEFGVSVSSTGETEVHVFEGSVEIQSRVRLPKHYWSFDDADFRDHAGELAATPRGGARRGAGLVSSGALHCDNARGSGLWIAAEDQNAFAVSTGVTVEALIQPRWSAEGWSTRSAYDYDEIFRKEDGHQRILLSFQNDHGPVPSVPSVSAGPCLSFGLNLAGHGYSELDMPLDGLEGRPALAELKDGKPHHVVASYNSYTGVKSIAIDGRIVFSTSFPAGTLIISGGTAPAIIGNLPAGIEPFDGSIDEVAFYDFALTEEEVADHFAHVTGGRNYFGQTPGESASASGGWKATTELAAGDAGRFDAVTGVSLGRLPADRSRFASPRRID